MKRILIVEDDKLIAHELANILENCGYEVCGSISTGTEAIEAAEEFRPDLVIMDIILHSEIKGTEAAECIYQKFRIPIVFLTSFTDDDTLEKATLSEPYGYLLKPVRERELHATLKMVFYKIEKEAGIIRDFPSIVHKRKLAGKEHKMKKLFSNILDKILNR